MSERERVEGEREKPQKDDLDVCETSRAGT